MINSKPELLLLTKKLYRTSLKIFDNPISYYSLTLYASLTPFLGSCYFYWFGDAYLIYEYYEDKTPYL